MRAPLEKIQSMRAPLEKGQWIGILGGGQLGMMLAQAAQKLGFNIHIYSDKKDAPAFLVANRKTYAPYEDDVQMTQFAKDCDVVTYEFENIPIESLAIKPLKEKLTPKINALAITQDRLKEKTFLQECSLPLAPFIPLSLLETAEEGLEKSLEESPKAEPEDSPKESPKMEPKERLEESPRMGLEEGLEEGLEGKLEERLKKARIRFGGAAILKACQFGYDGKAQWHIEDDTQAQKALIALKAMGAKRAVVESVIDFDKEASLIGARAYDGEIVYFDMAENIHKNHILWQSRVPIDLPKPLQAQAKNMMRTILEALDYVGVLAMELFVCKDKLLINELAPRVHNSGHWTQDASKTCQFAQHILAIAGHHLGRPKRTHNVVMHNILGKDIHKIMSENTASQKNKPQKDNMILHNYHKKEAKKGRKMGHINELTPLADL